MIYSSQRIFTSILLFNPRSFKEIQKSEKLNNSHELIELAFVAAALRPGLLAVNPMLFSLHNIACFCVPGIYWLDKTLVQLISAPWGPLAPDPSLASSALPCSRYLVHILSYPKI